MFILVLFIAIPLIEIILFAQVGAEIGLLQTILLCLLTAGVGMILVRKQGLDTLFSLNEANNRGEIPIQQIFDGFCIAVAGIFLITPGFFTDAVGFALLIPPVRAILRQNLARHIEAGTFGKPFHTHRNDPTSSPYNALDVEYEEISSEEIMTQLDHNSDAQDGKNKK